MPVKKSDKYDNSRFVEMGIKVIKPAKKVPTPKKKGKDNAKTK